MIRSCLVAAALVTGIPAGWAQPLPQASSALPTVPVFTLYDALGRPSNWTISGTLRPRVEALGGQFRPAPTAPSAALSSLQTTLFAESDFGPARIGGELIDGRATDHRRNSSSIATTGVNALELGQIYLGLDLGDAAGDRMVSTLTLSRCTQNIGSRRLVARDQFRNSLNAFTGVADDWRNAGADRLRLFYTLPHDRLPHDRLPQDRLPDDRAGILANGIVWDQEGFNLQFLGGHATKAGVLGGTLEAGGVDLIKGDFLPNAPNAPGTGDTLHGCLATTIFF